MRRIILAFTLAASLFAAAPAQATTCADNTDGDVSFRLETWGKSSCKFAKAAARKFVRYNGDLPMKLTFRYEGKKYTLRLDNSDIDETYLSVVYINKARDHNVQMQFEGEALTYPID